MKLSLDAALVLAFLIMSSGQSLETYVEKYILRLLPAAFPELPANLVEELQHLFIEKASVVWYFYEGQWLKLTGAD